MRWQVELPMSNYFQSILDIARRFREYDVSFDPPTLGLSLPYDIVVRREAFIPFATK